MRRSVRFYLGDERCDLTDFPPGLTLLDWLREWRSRTGTKEGCNEGDCGACTVLVVRLDSGKPVWRALNACIQLVGMMDGAQIFTVEDLRSADGRLHPVQTAMVEQHGAQCGFCTPGFVMSMVAYRKAPGAMDDEARIDEALAGNLCRCTGYAPIVRAMRQAMATGPDRFDGMVDDITQRLASLADGQGVQVDHALGRFSIPADVDMLAHIMAEDPGATLVAGGTDVGLWITKGLRDLPHIVAIGRIDDLRHIGVRAGELRIGAGVTYAEAREVLADWLPGADAVIGRIGAVQVRNAATIGGNIANGSPIGDGPPVLIAANATLHLRRGDSRRAIPLEAFFLAYGRQDRAAGEFVEGVSIPPLPEGAVLRAYKVSKRIDQDISAVLGAFALTFDKEGAIATARLAFGGMAATPRRAANAEAALLGRHWDRAALDAARAALASDFTPLSDMRASDWYRRTVAGNLLVRFFEETAGGAAVRIDRTGEWTDA
ncbi:xanthine dehydrogenase XdhA [Neoasaia chiangmaiensis NBRC 101099]|uniref:Xanthine dehydrogenase small subunit n=1 Tax=Neoasaia chiangmaiensis TaxID=320497 RepID=A0A1U9KS27_9PROT|nr:xanthine dehydrogenase small subunit [Neoasaia chiangmaiensis]AQS88608.1 xanthine dehydrogenase small subunit [Neoasaia chiangmaiensis]GBR36126.1 xanthine dehydrogenase XdhA [Neoasaia chiangmaiensis NBRC 101099]GEN15465.1 xanthine dehydrogenase small subunit [Neoasaia chiangmaiensis]